MRSLVNSAWKVRIVSRTVDGAGMADEVTSDSTVQTQARVSGIAVFSA